MTARALTYEERALDIEFGELPEFFDLQSVRQSYQQLFNRYWQLANAVATLQETPSQELLARIVRAADRWRALDPNDTLACASAARALTVMGAGELAWDYLTTPLAERPNEATPWQQLAQQLRQQGEFTLAERAYKTAFDLEDTNAQLLWDRATMLQQLGRHAEARALYRQIADTKWQPRFNWIQRRAKQYLAR
jgi:Flp pilus assembly protein TadD